MDEAQRLARAQRLAEEAIALCGDLGQPIAAAHIQLGLDLLGGAAPEADRLREDRSPWGCSEEPERP
jgi:hypothetical protein